MFSRLTRFIGSVASVAAFAVCSNSASAQENEANRSPSWDDIYVGASVGGGLALGRTSTFVQREILPSAFGNAKNETDTGRDSSAVITGDLFFGINKRLGERHVGGLQLEGSLVDLDFSSDGRSLVDYSEGGRSFFPTRRVQRIADVRLHRTVSLLGRLGWLSDPTMLLYGLAGFSAGRFSIDHLPAVDKRDKSLFPQGFGSWAVAPEIEKNGFEAWAINFGTGFEKKLGDNWSILTEYRYQHWLDITHDQTRIRVAPASGAKIIDVQTGNFENELHSLRMGVTRKLQLGS